VGGVFSHGGQLVATVSLDGSARLWDGNSGESRGELGDESEGLRISDLGLPPRDQEINAAFSLDDRLLITASLDGAVHIWNVENGTKLAVILGHTGLVEHIEFSPDGTRLLTASHDGTARLWDIDGALTTELIHATAPTFAAFSRDGARLVTFGEDSVVHVWDVETGSEIASFKDRGGKPLQHATFSPDGDRVATASGGGRVLLWQVESGREIREFEGNRSEVRHLQFNPSGSLLLSTALDGTARIWDASTGAQIRSLHPKGGLRNALFSPDGRLCHKLAVGSFDGTAQLWSIKDGGDPIALKGHDAPITHLEFSRDSRSILTASRDRTSRIWNAEDGAELVILRGHDGVLNSAALSPNGSYVVTTSSQDGTARLWAASSGRQIAILVGRKKQSSVRPMPTSAVFSPDGSHIAVISGDDNVRIIRAFRFSQELIDHAHSLVPRKLTPCERQRFFLAAEREAEDCTNQGTRD
jgi:WD40 repeat protein